MVLTLKEHDGTPISNFYTIQGEGIRKRKLIFRQKKKESYFCVLLSLFVAI